MLWLNTNLKTTGGRLLIMPQEEIDEFERELEYEEHIAGLRELADTLYEGPSNEMANGT